MKSKLVHAELMPHEWKVVQAMRAQDAAFERRLRAVYRKLVGRAMALPLKGAKKDV